MTETLCFFILYIQIYKIDVLSYNVLQNAVAVLFCLNPLFGYITTKYKLFGTRIKFYMLLTGVVSTAFYCVLANQAELRIPLPLFIVMNLTIETINSFRSVLIDSLSVMLLNSDKEAIHIEGASVKIVTLLFSSRLISKLLLLLLFSWLFPVANIKCGLNRPVRVRLPFPRDHGAVPGAD